MNQKTLPYPYTRDACLMLFSVITVWMEHFLLYSNTSHSLNSVRPIGAFQAKQGILCHSQVRKWLWAIGYSVAFGPVLGKMYRVYYIFNDPKPKKKRVMMNWVFSTLFENCSSPQLKNSHRLCLEYACCCVLVININYLFLPPTVLMKSALLTSCT